MNYRTPISLSWILALVVTLAGADDPERLKAKLQNADRNDQVKIYADLAEEMVEVARHRFRGGEEEQGLAAVGEAVRFAEQSAAASAETRKRMKQTEISLRKTANRLEDLARTLAFEQRQAIEKQIERVHAARTQLLHTMFAPKEQRK